MMSLLAHPAIIRRLPWSAGPADAELAAGAALLAGLEQTGAPALRWYRITPPALLLGSAQRLDEIDLAACAARGVYTHRRRSGGGAVLSDDALLLLDLALPRDHPLFRDDVTESYRWFGEVWAAALHELGLDPRVLSIAEARADTAALDPLTKRVCFGGLSPFEIALGQRKLVGLAQIRRRAGALFQAGVYLRWDPTRTTALIAAPADERAALAQRLAERVVGLDQLFGRQPDPALVMEAVEAALQLRAGLAPADDDWSEGERAARAAAYPRFAPIEATIPKPSNAEHL